MRRVGVEFMHRTFTCLSVRFYTPVRLHCSVRPVPIGSDAMCSTNNNSIHMRPAQSSRLCTRQGLCPTVRMLFVTLACVTAAKLPNERRDPPENSSEELLVTHCEVELLRNAASQPLAIGRPRRRLPHSSYLAVYGRAVLMLATVVVAQTVGAASWMGPLAGRLIPLNTCRFAPSVEGASLPEGIINPPAAQDPCWLGRPSERSTRCRSRRPVGYRPTLTLL